MRFLTVLITLFFLSPLSGQPISKLSLTLGFDSGSSELNGNALQLLNSIADTLGQAGITIKSIHLEGHTDREGSALANQKLSARRVAFIVNYLETKGLVLNGLETNYYGEERPLSSAEDEIGRARNRRVQVRVEIQDSRPLGPSRTVRAKANAVEEQPVSSQPLDTPDRKYLQALLSESLSLQTFTIPVATTSQFRTRDGMVFSFPANTFLNNCSDSVTISLQEYNDAQSMIKSNMTTTSDGRLLYSLGMYEIKAHCQGDETLVEPQQDYTVFVPYQKQEERTPDNVFLFTGQRDSLTGAVNWQQDSYKRQDPLLGDWMCGGSSQQGCQLFKNLFRTKRERQADKRLGMERDKIAQRYQKVDFSVMDNLLSNEVYYYVFESSKMGLTNYDIFWKLPAEKLVDQKVVLATPITNNTEVMLYFKNRRSLVAPLKYHRNYVTFPQIPKDEAVYVVALRVEEGERRVKLAIKEGLTGGEQINLVLEEVPSLKKLDEALALISR